MRFTPRLALPAAVAVALGSVSCGEDGPTRVGRPPVVQGFSPSDQAFTAFVGDTLTFTIRAFDPDQGALNSEFLLADSVVGSGTHWNYIVDDTGAVTVKAVVRDDTYSARISWEVSRYVAIDLPPVIQSYLPLELNPTMVIGTTLDFSVRATDPEKKPVQYFFRVDDAMVASGDDYTYTATALGLHLVEAVASDGVHSSVQAWNVKVTTEPDTIPPAEVVITNLQTGTNPGDVDVEWIAVGQNGMEGTASNYHVRTSPAPILNETDWQRASDRPNVPEPLPAGELMSMTIVDIIPARFTYVAIRAVDDFGNLSPLSASIGVNARGMHVTGIVRDAQSNLPMADVTVRLAHQLTTTAADGTFEFFELGPVDGDITATEDGVGGVIGAYYDFAMPYVITHEDNVELFLIPSDPTVSAIYPDFYLWFRAMTDIPGIPESTQQRRWELPIDIYIPEFSNGGLDYKQVIMEVIAEFDQYLGRPVFNIVDAQPALGVHIAFVPGLKFDNWGIVSWDSERYPIVGRIEHRTGYSAATENTLRRVARHELGHALGLNHSEDTYHVMIGGTAPTADAMTIDEIRILNIRYNLPRGLDVRWFGAE